MKEICNSMKTNHTWRIIRNRKYSFFDRDDSKKSREPGETTVETLAHDSCFISFLVF